jgi:glucose/arabinose dehydrogenase
MRIKNLLIISAMITTQFSFSQTNQLIGSTMVSIDTLSTDVQIPWEIKVMDNYLWVTERSGKLSRINLQTGVKSELLNLTTTVNQTGESGMLGMTFHPDFPNTPEIFLVYTYGTPNGQGFFKERLVKYTFNGTSLINEVILLDDIMAWSAHNGSRLHFLPDGTLLMSTGECYEDQLAQDPNSLSGKYLRLTTSGAVPADNPTPGSYVYSMGHRNSQGICALPNGKIIISEHGPSTDDELTVLEAGKNYGWPLIHGFCDENFENTPCATGQYTEPIHAWTPTIATSDLVYYENDAFPEWNDRLLMVTLNGQRLVALQLNAATTDVMDEDQYLQGQFGRLRDIAVGPNKELYIATNSGVQSIIRITPPTDVANLAEIGPGNPLVIVPNPAEQFIRLEGVDGPGKVSIYDLRGKVVFTKERVEINESMDVDVIQAGNYWLKWESLNNETEFKQRFTR